MKFCPNCGEDLGAYLAGKGSSIVPQASAAQGVSVQRNYDQTKTWKELVQRAREIGGNPPDITELAISAATGLTQLMKTAKEGGLPTIVHLLFDKNITPMGGILYQAAMLDGKMSSNEDQLRSMGYGISDGKVDMAESVPVGPAYGLLNYWGGDKQYRRWHLAEPIKINPSRNGERFFMDENMIAFGAKWQDGDRVEAGLLELLGLFERGIGGQEHVAQPIALQIVAQAS